MLTLSPALVLPLDAVTETFAILGRRGSGKTHTAVVMAEEMLGAGVQVIVLDPLDVWWGLRVSSDGKAAGIPIYVAGGSHQDIPLLADSGRVLADVVVDKGLSVVLSLRHLSKSDGRRFVADFVEHIYDRKGEDQHRTPLHLFVDEADAFVPQRLVPGSERCFGAVDTAVRRGRASGMAITLLSQRPQVVNKDVLSQTEILVAHQLTGPQDRKALETWIDAHDTGNVGAEFMASLASLPKGTAWFWSPGLLNIFRKVAVRDRRTFDSSATPKPGAAVAKPKAFAAVDLAALTTEIQATVERAKADDPRELKKTITDLQRELAKAAAHVSAKPEPVRHVTVVEKPVITDAQLVQVDQALSRVEKAIERAAEVLAGPVGKLRGQLQQLGEAMKAVRQPPLPMPSAPPARVAVAGRVVSSPSIPPPSVRQSTAALSSVALSGPEQRIVDAIAWLEAIGNGEPQQVAVAFLANYTYGAGSFNNPRGSLRQKGYVEYRGDRIVLTDTGRVVARMPVVPLSAEELHARVLGRLPGPEQRVLRPLLEAYPEAVSNQDLAERAGYAAGAGSFNNPKGRLRSLGLIDYPQPGMAVAKSLLFLEA